MPAMTRQARPAKCLEPPEGCGAYATCERKDGRGPYSIWHARTCPIDRAYRAREQVISPLAEAALACYTEALVRLAERGLVTVGSPGWQSAREVCAGDLAAELEARGVIPREH